MKKFVLLTALLFSFSLLAGFSAQAQAESAHSEEQLAEELAGIWNLSLCYDREGKKGMFTLPVEKRVKLILNADGSAELSHEGRTQACTWSFDPEIPVENIPEDSYLLLLTLENGSSITLDWWLPTFDDDSIFPHHIYYRQDGITYFFNKPHFDFPQSLTSVSFGQYSLLTQAYEFNTWTAYAFVSDSGVELVPPDKADLVVTTPQYKFKYLPADGLPAVHDTSTVMHDNYYHDGIIFQHYHPYLGDYENIDFFLCIESEKPVYFVQMLENGHLIYLSPEGLDYVERTGIQPY